MVNQETNPSHEVARTQTKTEKDAYRFVNGVLDEYCKAQEEE